MSRVSSGTAPRPAKANNNVYTALAGIALLIALIAFLVLFMQASVMFDKGLFGN